MNNSMRVTGLFGLVLTFFSLYAFPVGALSQTKAMQPAIDLCPQAKLLIDRVAGVILNKQRAEAFDLVVKNVLDEICSLRKSSEASPELKPVVDNLVVAVLGWAWNVSTLMTFKAERNSVPADIAAKEVKRNVTAIQTICPTMLRRNLPGEGLQTKSRNGCR
ncbi:MAG: hypothetical protein ACLQPD_18530 [Desulfomonilaceae bacterium]